LLKVEKDSEARKRLFYQKIREGLVSGSLWNDDTLDEVRDGHECIAPAPHPINRLLTSEVHENVFIDALCLFDTVASLGVPKVGAGSYIAPILRMLPPFRNDYAHFESIVTCPPESKLTYLTPEIASHFLTNSCAAVRHVFQATSIQETRATYHEQVAQQQPSASNQVFKQMWFFGNHSSMGRNTGRNGFADAPLAWMIGQLHHYLRLRFDEVKLHKRFPSYPRSVNLADVARPIRAVVSTTDTGNSSSNASTHIEGIGAAPTGPLPRWIHNDIKKFGAFKRFCHGWNQRTPGCYGDRAFEEVHITVRLRGFGRNRTDSSMIPGYQIVADGRTWVWRRLPPERAKTRRWITGEKKPAALPFINEAKMLPLEAALLGLSWCLEM
jgi:hypothetical protein